MGSKTLHAGNLRAKSDIARRRTGHPWASADFSEPANLFGAGSIGTPIEAQAVNSHLATIGSFTTERPCKPMCGCRFQPYMSATFRPVRRVARRPRAVIPRAIVGSASCPLEGHVRARSAPRKNGRPGDVAGRTRIARIGRCGARTGDIARGAELRTRGLVRAGQLRSMPRAGQPEDLGPTMPGLSHTVGAARRSA